MNQDALMSTEQLIEFMSKNNVTVFQVENAVRQDWKRIRVIDTPEARSFIETYQEKVGTNIMRSSALTAYYVMNQRINLIVFVHKIDIDSI